TTNLELVMLFHEKVARALAQRGVRRSELIDHIVARAIERGQPPEEARRGASKATVGRWLTGRSIPNALQAGDIAAFLEVPLDFLVDSGQDEPTAIAACTEPAQSRSNKLDLRVNDVAVTIAWPASGRAR